MKKLILIVISIIFVLLSFCTFNERPKINETEWTCEKIPLDITLVDSFNLPDDFPKYFLELYKYENNLIYTYSDVGETGYVNDLRMSVLNLNTGDNISISTGRDRVGQMRQVNKLLVQDDLIYSIDPNRQIIANNMKLEQVEKLTIDCSDISTLPDGGFFIKYNNFYLSSLRSSPKQSIYSPVALIDSIGKAQYLNSDIKINRIKNQMRDYPFVLADTFEDKLVVLPQHYKYFFIIDIPSGHFRKINFPDDIPIDETPALNKVDKNGVNVIGKYIKNAAIKWCRFEKEKVDLVFHLRDYKDEEKSKYQYYSLDLNKMEFMSIDSLPFTLQLFVSTNKSNELVVLENKTIYVYIIKQ